MLVVGIIALLLAYLVPMPAGIASVLLVLGWIGVVVGLVLLVLGFAGNGFAGRRYWY
jgi:hypothetical protein